jgi:TPR repeat protein
LISAAKKGAWPATVLIIRQALTRNRAESLVQGLQEAVLAASPDAMYILGLELLKGEPPFKKNATLAVQFFKSARTLEYHAASYQLANLGYTNLGDLEWSCDDSIWELLSFLETSFLFDDARKAWKAVTARDLPYARRMYERLADMGSDTAAWNAERLCTETGMDGSQWFDLQVKMKHRKAIARLGEKQIEHGELEQGLDNMRKAASSDNAAAFGLAWMLRKSNPVEADVLFERAKMRRNSPKLAVNLAIAWSVIELVPRALVDWCSGKQTESLAFVHKYIRQCSFPFVIVVEIMALYLLIGARVRATLQQIDQ